MSVDTTPIMRRRRPAGSALAALTLTGPGCSSRPVALFWGLAFPMAR
jgi:hypothetical protein